MPCLGPDQLHLTMMAPFHDGTQHLWWLRGTIACGTICRVKLFVLGNHVGENPRNPEKRQWKILPVFLWIIFFCESTALHNEFVFDLQGYDQVSQNCRPWTIGWLPFSDDVTLRQASPARFLVFILFKMCLNWISYLRISEFCSDFNFEHHGKVKLIIVVMASYIRISGKNSALPFCCACPSKWPFLKLLSQWRLATHPPNSQIRGVCNQVRSTIQFHLASYIYL